MRRKKIVAHKSHECWQNSVRKRIANVEVIRKKTCRNYGNEVTLHFMADKKREKNLRTISCTRKIEKPTRVPSRLFKIVSKNIFAIRGACRFLKKTFSSFFSFSQILRRLSSCKSMICWPRDCVETKNGPRFERERRVVKAVKRHFSTSSHNTR